MENFVITIARQHLTDGTMLAKKLPVSLPASYRR